MPSSILVNLLAFYGVFLICAGIISVLFIGLKAKTALISGGSSGLLALTISYLFYLDVSWAPIAGIGLCTGLFVVFSWRSTKTLFRLMEMIQSGHEEIKTKGIAFLIISLMAVITLFTLALQLILLGIDK